jgi:hypothetical protein
MMEISAVSPVARHESVILGNRSAVVNRRVPTGSCDCESWDQVLDQGIPGAQTLDL